MIVAEVLIVLTILLWCGGVLYTHFGVLKFLYHDIMGWHMPNDKNHLSYDGYFYYSECKYCGEHLIKSNQGGWFERR